MEIFDNRSNSLYSNETKDPQDSSPLVSIITVVYNGEHYIEETILSVINQTYENIQYIIIDGNSKDRTLDIIKKYNNSIDQWISEDDDGIYHAMNHGASLSRGELIGFLNAGDFLFEDTIDNLVFGYHNNNFDFSLGPTIIQDEQGAYVRTYQPIEYTNVIDSAIIPMPSAHMSIYMKKSFFNNLRGFDLNFQLSSDYDLLLRAKDLSKNIWYFKDPVGVFKMGGISGSFKTHFDNYRVYKKHSMSIMRRSFLLIFFLLRASMAMIIPNYILYRLNLFLSKK